MILGRLDIPDELLDASRSGDLLVFAGAGVSMGGSSRYPSFARLCDLLSRQTHHRRRSSEQMDTFLGSLEDHGVDVHAEARNILDNKESKPNPLHRDIVGLFGDQHIRLITTNLDRHFTAAAGRACPIYYSPTLPLGDDFNGIVYVHGAVEEPSSKLVLTDRDFGYAYSSEGWARRFLSDALSRYTVLFIGYSLNDPPMHYLTRGLKVRQGRHFAMSTREDVERWHRLGIEPIGYPKCGGRNAHGFLHTSMSAWAKYMSMKTFDHKRRIESLLKQNPDLLDPCDRSYLEHCFRDSLLIRFFYGDGLRPCWLFWAEQAHLLDPAFSAPVEEHMAYSHHVAHWFSRHAITNHQEALAVYVRARMSMPKHLWMQLASMLHCQDKCNRQARAQWSTQLCMQWHPSYSTDYLEYAMMASAKQADFGTTLMLLDFLATPRVVLERSFLSYSDPSNKNATSAKVKLCSTHGRHWFEELWKKYLQPNLNDFASRLCEMATDKLEQAYELSALQSDSDEPFDEICYQRSAIEPNPQDDYRTEFHVLEDMARDSHHFLTQQDPQISLGFTKRWMKSRSQLLHRLAVHAMRVNTRIQPSKKLTWVIRDKLLARIGLHHEVFLLVREVFPQVTPSLQSTFLHHLRSVTHCYIQDNPDVSPEAYWHHEFSILAVLTENMVKKSPALCSRLAYLKKRFPRFRLSDHPEFTHWSGAGVGLPSALKTTDLRRMKIGMAVRYICTYKGDRSRGFRREGILSLLYAAVVEDVDWSLQLSLELKKARALPADIWPQVVNGWSTAKLTEQHWPEILKILRSSWKGQHLPVRQTAQLLLAGLKKGGTLPESALNQAEDISFMLLRQARKMPPCDPDPQDWYGWAINDAGGILCRVFLTLASKRALGSLKRLQRLDQRFRLEFRSMMKGLTAADQAARTTLAHHVHYLSEWDPVWTKRYLLPAFGWRRNRLRATQIWHGYLSGGKWHRTYVSRLIPCYTQSLKYIGSKGPLSHKSERLASHIVSLCMESTSRRARGPLLVAFFKNASDKDRLAFADAVHSILDGLSLPQRRTVWRSWLGSYWRDRGLGKPVPLAPPEIDKMVGWMYLLDADFPEAVEILTKIKTPAGSARFSCHWLLETDLAKNFPLPMAKLLAYILQSHDGEWVDTQDFLQLASDLVKVTETHEFLGRIVELLASKGSVEGAEKLNAALKAP